MTIPRPIVPNPRTATRLSSLGTNPLVIIAFGLSVIPLRKKVLMLPLASFERTTSTKFFLLDLQPLGERYLEPLVHRVEGQHGTRKLPPPRRLEDPRLRHLGDGIDLGEVLDGPFQVGLSRDDLLEEGLRRRKEVAPGGDQPVDDSQLQRLRRGQHRPLQDQLDGRVADEPGQALRPAGAGKEPHVDLGQADQGGLPLLGDPPRAGQRELQAAAEAVAVNGRDPGDGQGGQPVEGAVEKIHRLVHPVGGLDLGDQLQVGAGEEGLRLSRDEDEPADPLRGFQLLRSPSKLRKASSVQVFIVSPTTSKVMTPTPVASTTMLNTLPMTYLLIDVVIQYLFGCIKPYRDQRESCQGENNIWHGRLS